MDNYLLEKSRVTNIPKDELNYHIFYSFFKGLKQLQEIKQGMISKKDLLKEYNWGYGDETDQEEYEKSIDNLI